MKLFSIIECPHCGGTTEEQMPTDACVYFYDCPACNTRIQPAPGDCCVFCSFADTPCPPIQDRQDRC